MRFMKSIMPIAGVCAVMMMMMIGMRRSKQMKMAKSRKRPGMMMRSRRG
jgi:hypothetical protein